MAAILCTKLLSTPGARPPRCVILISGFARPSPAELSAWYPPAQPLPLPSMHVWGAADDHIPPVRDPRLPPARSLVAQANLYASGV